jgi:DNA adenine methylase
MSAAPTRPLIRYHGGKWRLAPWIISHFPAHRVYVEPFGGGASVLLQKPRSYAEVYNDLDGELVNLFRVVRDHGPDLRTALEHTPFAREEFDLSFDRVANELEQARRTIVRAYMGFGSTLTRPLATDLEKPMRTGFRACSNRTGTTPARDWRNLPDKIGAIIARLQGVVIEHRQACEVMKQHDAPKALHYVDPPYVHSTRTPAAGGNHRGYRYEMCDMDHVALAEFLHTLQGGVILSGYHSALYDALFAKWACVECATHADGAKDRTEVLWFRNVDLHGDLFTASR